MLVLVLVLVSRVSVCRASRRQVRHVALDARIVARTQNYSTHLQTIHCTLLLFPHKE